MKKGKRDERRLKDFNILNFRDKLRQILVIKESPRKMATAFAIGVFIGMSPLLGIHTVLGILAAWLFRLNRLVTLVGVYVTNPWTIVPIYSFGTWIGAKIIGMNKVIPVIDWTQITFLGFLKEFRPLLLPFIIGNTVVGLVSAVLSYFILYNAAKKYRG